jgi:hypothetical protein
MTTETKHTPETDAVDITARLPHLKPARGRSDWPMQYAKIIGHARKLEIERNRVMAENADLLAALTEARYAMFNAKADFGTNHMDDAIEQADAAIERATKG